MRQMLTVPLFQQCPSHTAVSVLSCIGLQGTCLSALLEAAEVPCDICMDTMDE